MAVIYCNSCDLGIHYTDVCWGGKNGKPRLTAKQHLVETIKVWTLGAFGAIVISAIILFAITEGFTNWN